WRTSGIKDVKSRVGHYPDRIEAEVMDLQGYAPIDVTPPENASGGKGVGCRASSCTAIFEFNRPPGWYEMDVQYFDQNNGESKFRIFVGDQLVDQWVADDHLPGREPGGDSSTRQKISGLALRRGDRIRIEGVPDGAEAAPLDYVELHKSSSNEPEPVKR